MVESLSTGALVTLVIASGYAIAIGLVVIGSQVMDARRERRWQEHEEAMRFGGDKNKRT